MNQTNNALEKPGKNRQNTETKQLNRMSRHLKLDYNKNTTYCAWLLTYPIYRSKFPTLDPVAEGPGALDGR
jgi:hypothetical protein